MCVVLKFPLDRVQRANDVTKKNDLQCAQIIMFDGIRYSRPDSKPVDEHSGKSKPAKPC